ncbi:hypothetical protein ACH4FA_36480 [Streptomyces sp. NPDC017966]|uniref:hypothetical protein n=1 Tax=Streptomyces sp. NPDC017966 TaxID=3365023 RepID=UPI0037935176
MPGTEEPEGAAGRSWEGTAILRRTMATTGPDPHRQVPVAWAGHLYWPTEQPSAPVTEQVDLLAELLDAGLVEEADTLAHLRLLARVAILAPATAQEIPYGSAGSRFGYSEAGP